MMEYKIANKIDSIMGNSDKYPIRSTLIYTRDGKVIQLLLESEIEDGVTKNFPVISLFDKQDPAQPFKVRIDSQLQIDLLISQLANNKYYLSN